MTSMGSKPNWTQAERDYLRCAKKAENTKDA